jgi:hypothetical protein
MSLRCKMYQIMLQIVKFKHSHCCSSDLRLCQRQEQLLRQQSGQDEVRCSLLRPLVHVGYDVEVETAGQ